MANSYCKNYCSFFAVYRKIAKMKKRILSVLISGFLLFGTVFANAVSIGFGDLERSDQTSDLEEDETISDETESNIFFEDLEQSDKTSDIEEVLEIDETDSCIDEYYFPEATEENIQTLSLDSETKQVYSLQ